MKQFLKQILVTSASILITLISFSQTFTTTVGSTTYASYGTACKNVTVTGLSGFLNHNLGLKSVTLNVTSANIGNVNVKITSPDGTVFSLVVGGYGNYTGANFTNTVLTQNNSPLPLPSTSNASVSVAPFTGNFRPNDFNFDFCNVNNNVRSGNGTWIVCIESNYNGGAGTFINASLNFGVNAPSEYGTNVASDALTSSPYQCDLTGYTGWTSDCYGILELTGTNIDAIDGISDDNTSYVKVMPTGTTLDINFSIQNCATVAGSNGIQMVFLRPLDASLTQFEKIATGSVSSSYSMGTYTETIPGLEPGEPVYILFDGYANDVCEYVINSFSYSGSSDLMVQAIPSFFCAGAGVTSQIMTQNVVGATYVWTPSTGLSSTSIYNPIATVNSTTTYTVVATDPVSGCVFNDAITITVNPLPLTFAGNDASICSGFSTSLTASAVGVSTTGIIEFKNTSDVVITDNSLTGVNSTIAVSGINPSTYSTARINKVCMNIDHADIGDLSATLTAPNGSVMTLTSYEGVGPDYINACFVVSGGASINYNTSGPLWTNYAPFSSFTGITSGSAINGNWTLSVIDNNSGNIGTLTDWTIFFNDNILYNWTPTTNLGTPTVATTSANPSTTTTYTASIIDGNGCVATDNVTVIVNPTPIITGTLTACIGSTTQLSTTSTPAISSPWVSSNTSKATVSSTGLVTGIATGTVTITFTDINGCLKTSTITILPLISISGTLTFCLGATSQLTGSASPAISSPWISSNVGVASISNTGLVTSLTSGSTTITYTNTNGCSITSLVTVIPNITPTFVTVSAICLGAPAPVLPTSSTNTPAITGTWSPVVSNIVTGIYTFTPTAGLCALATSTLTVAVTPNVTPTFSAVSAICSGATAPILPTSSTNTPAITGTWSPVVSNTATGTYTFTPTAGLCALATTTLTVAVTPNVTPTFAAVSAICSGATAPVLPTSSTNTPAITGTWSPAVSNTATGIYTFTPTAGLCALATTTLTVTVTPNVTPTFLAVSAICSGESAPVLPTSSTNTPAITGTWSPAVSNTATGTYTFTPTAGLCALATTTLTVTVTPNVTPTFAAVSAICSGATVPVLPTSSTNTPAITGTWFPAVSNTATGTYTFTPASGLCAMSTTTLTVTVNSSIVTPTFNSVYSICSGGISPILPNVSDDLILGSWSPAVNNTATGTYTFTPNSGQCAISTTLTVTVSPNVTPTFAAVSAICSGAASPVLPTSSTNTPAITGTWSSAVSNTSTGTYTFTPTAGLCALATTTLTVTVTPNVTPTFTAVSAICSGTTAPVLPTSSINTPAITGTWSPAVSNTLTGTYTFSPVSGFCALSNSTLTVTVTPNVTPTFGTIPAICSGAIAPVLPTSSTNIPAITGTWSSLVSNTATGTYTFTPTAGLCALSTTTLTVTVSPNVTPTFGTIPVICSGATAPVLPTSSTNTPAITGTWSSVVSNTATGTYTFTPTIGLCALSTTTLIVTVTPNVTPIFATIPAICSGATVPVLPTSSTNTPAITGTWSSVVSNTATGTYTFIPTAGFCALATTTLTVTVAPNVTPTFGTIPAICSGATAPVLPTSSTNTPAITGTWSSIVSNTATGTYTFIPTTGLCALSTTTLTVTVAPNVTPIFNVIAPFCSGAAVPILPMLSTNLISGTWLPSSINNMQSGSYVFTPTNGQCSSNNTITVTINPTSTPIFNTVSSICAGSISPILPLTSNNLITGTWTPSVVNNLISGTYLFTPTSGVCANSVSKIIQITPNLTPTFSFGTSICENTVAPILPLISNESILGSWNPSVVVNTISGSYTFTPLVGQCSFVKTITVNVEQNPSSIIGFTQTYCQNATASPINFIYPLGVDVLNWYATNQNNSASTTNIPTPNTANEGTTNYYVSGVNNITGCESSISVITIIVSPNAIPTFLNFTSFCEGDEEQLLPLISNNTPSISGTWSNSMINTSLVGTSQYIFTPSSGICAIQLVISIVVNPKPEALFSVSSTELTSLTPQIYLINNSIDANSYLWNFGDGNVSTEYNTEHTYPLDFYGTYTVSLTATSPFGCVDAKFVDVKMIEELIYFIPNTFTPDGNKFNETFQPVFTSGYDPNDYTLIVTNRWGQTVFETNDASKGWNGRNKNEGEESEIGTYSWVITFRNKNTEMRKQIFGSVNLVR